MWHIYLLRIIIHQTTQIRQLIDIIDQVIQIIGNLLGIPITKLKFLFIYLAKTIKCFLDGVEVQVSAAVLVFSELQQKESVGGTGACGGHYKII